jgi:Ras family
MNDTFTEATDRKSTMGLDHYGRTFNVGDRDLKLQLWDTGGATDYHRLLKGQSHEKVGEFRV